MDFNPRVVCLADGSAVAAAAMLPASDGDTDVLVLKIDSEGNPLWSKQFRSAGFEDVCNVALCKDGNVVIAGTTAGPEEINGMLPVNTFAIKVTPSGGLLWNKKYSYTGTLNNPEFSVKAVKALSDGGFILAGELGHIKYNLLGGDYLVKDMWVVKCDAGGRKVWSKRFRNMLSAPDYYTGLDSAVYDDFLCSAAENADGSILLQGSCNAIFRREAAYKYYRYIYEKRDYVGWVMKLTSGGKVLFTRGYRDPAQTKVTEAGTEYEKVKSNSIYLNCLDVTAAGDIIATGFVNIGPYPGLTSLLIFKADGDGKIGNTTMGIKNLSPSVMSISFAVAGIDSTYSDVSAVRIDSSVRELADTDYAITGM